MFLIGDTILNSSYFRSYNVKIDINHLFYLHYYYIRGNINHF